MVFMGDDGTQAQAARDQVKIDSSRIKDSSGIDMYWLRHPTQTIKDLIPVNPTNINPTNINPTNINPIFLVAIGGIAVYFLTKKKAI